MGNVIKSEVVPAADGKFVRVSTADLSGPFENNLILDRAMFVATGGHIETMVFPADETGKVLDWGDLDCARTAFTDITAAHAQHANMVAKWKVSQ